MKRIAVLLGLAAVMVVPCLQADAQDGETKKKGEAMAALQRRALASERFRTRVAAVNSNEGWQGTEADKANAGRVRVYGVCNLGTGIAVILPRRAMTVEGTPELRTVTLEFGQGSMTRWRPEGLTLPENAELWLWSGSQQARFQFSFTMSAGANCWG